MKYIYLIVSMFNPFFLIGYFFIDIAEALREYRTEQKKGSGWTVTIK